MADPIRILIIDDHAIVRRGLAMVLRQEADFEVIGEAQNGREGLEMAARLHPHLVLLDLIMPEMDGKATALALRSSHPKIKIIMLTGIELDDRLFELLEMGIEGFVMKDVEPAQLIEAIHLVMRGEAYFSKPVLQRLLARIRKGPSSPAPPSLTAREQEVLQWMATPMTYRQIAHQLGVSEETIRTHARNILEKMGQPNRAQAVLAALRQGLIKMPE
jgi:two-component system nitrate/nitrite response regulator NarL